MWNNSNISQHGSLFLSTPSWTAWLQGAMSVLAIVLSVMANGLIVLLWLQSKALRTAANYPILNLAIKGLLSAILNGVLFLKFSVLDREFKHDTSILWTFQVLECFFYFLNVLSILNLMVNKYCAVVYQLKYYVWNTKFKSFSTIIVVWIVSAILDGFFQVSLLSTREKYDRKLGTLSFLELKRGLFKHAQTSRLIVLFLPMGIVILFALTICVHLRIGIRKTRKLSGLKSLNADVVRDSIVNLALIREIELKNSKRKEEDNSTFSSTQIREIIKLAAFKNIVLDNTNDSGNQKIKDLEASATSNVCCSAQLSESNCSQTQSEIGPTDRGIHLLCSQCKLSGFAKKGKSQYAKSTIWKRSKSENDASRNNRGISDNYKNGHANQDWVELDRCNIVITDQSLACTEKKTNGIPVPRRPSIRERRRSRSYVKDSGNCLDCEIICEKCDRLANHEEILSFVNIERATKRKRKIGIQDERENAAILNQCAQTELVNNRQRREDDVLESYYNAEVHVDEEALKIEPVARQITENKRKSISLPALGELQKMFHSPLKRKGPRRHVSQAETNLVKSMLSILLCVMAYVVCHVPFLVEILLTESGFSAKHSQRIWLQFFSLYFILLNDICNPVLYCLRCDRFYRASICLFRKFCRRNERERFSRNNNQSKFRRNTNYNRKVSETCSSSGRWRPSKYLPSIHWKS